MGTLNEVLYDHIGRSYKRYNKYLEDLSILENELKGTKNKKEIFTKINDLKKNKDKHPYIIKLNKYREEEKKFIEAKNSDLSKYKNEIANEDDKDILEKIKEFTLNEKFYASYSELDYEAKLKYEEAKIALYHLPLILKFREETKEDIKAAQDEKSKIQSKDIEKAKVLHDEKLKEAKAQYEEAKVNLISKRKEGVISQKALQNGKGQLKKELESKIQASNFILPDKSIDEKIKTLEYNFKEKTKLMYKIMNKDIADLRRKTPVEIEKRVPWISLITFPLPGLGQLLNGQIFKSVLFFIASLFIYGAALPYALGKGNYQGQGLKGLYTLAQGAIRLHKSQIYMIEGIIALVLMAIALAILIVSFMDVFKVETGKIKGIREQNTFETKNSMSENGFPYFVSLPALLFILFIVIVPLITTILMSFTNMDPNHQSKFTWVGLDNFRQVISGKGIAGQAFWNIFSWTLIWTLVATTLAIVVGFGLALLANNPRIKGKGFFRMVYLLPWAVPAFVTIMFFSLLMGPNGFISNIVNHVSAFFGGNPDIRIKSDTNATRAALILLQTWLGSSYVFLLSTGVLQAIPEELYEAAQIDGASPLQKIMKITIPLVTFQTAPLLVGQYTFNFNNFNIIYLFNQGGPFDTSKYGNLAGSSDLLISYIYKLTMESKYQSLAAAITLLISLALMFFAYLGFRNSKAFKEEKL